MLVKPALETRWNILIFSLSKTSESSRVIALENASKKFAGAFMRSPLPSYRGRNPGESDGVSTQNYLFVINLLANVILS
jgi:hypothetical protein